jgi:cytochrome c553
MKRPICIVVQVLFVIVCVWPVVGSAQSESAGVAQYFNNCASCHENTDATHQAPRTSVLKQMSPERVLDVLTNGSMRSNAAAISDADKRLIAEWVAGRKIDNESVGAAEKMTNLCSSHPPLRESGALLSAARDGMVRAVSSRTGQLLWEFDTAREFTTVNGVPIKGGSGASGGPIVANGMVFIGSGYPGFQNGQPGNVLLAFAPAVRLDAYAEERMKKANESK